MNSAQRESHEGNAHGPAQAGPYRYGVWTALVLTLIVLATTELLLPLGMMRLLLFLPRLVPSLLTNPKPLDPWLELGGIVSVAAIIKVPIAVALVYGAARLRSDDPTELLGLRTPPVGDWFKWLAAIVGLVCLLDLVRVGLGRPFVPEWLDTLYVSAPSKALLLAAVLLAAPIVEELVFRGFLLPALAESRLGGTTAVLVTSLLFTALHQQYADWYDLLSVFLIGALLGAARLRTGSTLVTMALHAAANAVAMLELTAGHGFRP